MPDVHKFVPDLRHINEIPKWSVLNPGLPSERTLALLPLSCQPHASGGGSRWGCDVGGTDLILITFDVELQGGSVLTHVEGDGSTHHQWKIDVAMPSGYR